MNAFAAHAIQTLNSPPEPIDPERQARAYLVRARECIRHARYAREDGAKTQSALWLAAARNLRAAAAAWLGRRGVP